MGHRVWLRKLFHLEKLCVSQFHRLAEHFEKTEKDRDLNHHRQTAADWIDAVLLVKLHQLLVHPGRIIFVFILQLLHFRRECSHLPHGTVRSVLNWPQREFDDGGESQDGEAIVPEPAVQQVHEVEQKLTHQLEYAEVHDLRLIMRKLREAMVKFRPNIDFETRAVGLPGRQPKPRHPKRALDAEQLLIRRALDIETAAPNAGRFGGERREQGGEKLITHRNPFCAGDSLLIIGARSALTQAEKTATATKPTYVDTFGPSVDAPAQTCVRRIIPGMNRRRGSKRHKITAALMWLGPPILKIEIHFNHVVVFVLRRLLEKELFPDSNLLGRHTLKLHRRIRHGRCSELRKRWRGWLLDDCADRRALRRIQNDALFFLGYLLEQDRFLNSTTTICQAQLDI